MTSLSDIVQLAQKRKAEQLNSSGPDAKRRKYMTKKEREEEVAMVSFFYRHSEQSTYLALFPMHLVRKTKTGTRTKGERSSQSKSRRIETVCRWQRRIQRSRTTTTHKTT
jgi:hypothetical protein